MKKKWAQILTSLHAGQCKQVSKFFWSQLLCPEMIWRVSNIRSCRNNFLMPKKYKTHKRNIEEILEMLLPICL